MVPNNALWYEDLPELPPGLLHPLSFSKHPYNEGYIKGLYLLTSYVVLDYDLSRLYYLYKFTTAFFYLMFLMDVLLFN